MEDLFSLGKLTLISWVRSCQKGNLVLFVMRKIGNFSSILPLLGALVIYASLVFMGARLKSLL